MTEYSGIRGTRVKYLSSDPTLDTSTEGQVWYNSTEGTLKSLVQIKAWSSGGNMPTATSNNGSATQGTQTASLSFGGGNTLPQTVEYNGFSWTASDNLGTPRYVISGAGVQTAALGFGGYTLSPNAFTTATEEYDGSSWTAGGALPSARANMGANGTQTAAIAVGGYPLSPANVTEEYNGSSWTAGGAYPIALQDVSIAGPQTAALGAGGILPGAPTGAQTIITNYDGTSWTVVSGTIPNGQNRAAYAGTQTHAVVFGGNTNASGPPNGVVTTATNEWDGSTFAITANMATARQSYAGAGTATAAIGFAGDKNPGASDDTEEYNSNLNAITQAVWSAGGNVNTAIDIAAGAGGSVNAGLKFSGGPPNTAATEEYNGSAWTSVNNMNTARRGVMGTGVQTSAVAIGGYEATNSNKTEEYDGTNWTAVTVVPSTLSSATAFGIQTAAVIAGGNSPLGWVQTTLEYDGTNYSSGGTMPATTGAQHQGSAGTLTAGLVFGGYIPPSALGVTTASYDGSSWSAENNMLISRYTSGSGTQTAALAPGGYQNANPLNPGAGFTLACEQYDGTSWSNTCNNNITRGYQINQNRASNAPGTTGLVFGGSAYPAPGNINSSEEFTGGISVTTASTLTTS